MGNAFSYRDAIDEYQGNSALVVFFLVALIYIVYFANNFQIKRYIVVVVMSVILVFNNILLVIWKKILGEDIVFIFFSAVPCFGCSAYLVCHVFKEMKGIKERILFGMVVAVTLYIGGDINGIKGVINNGQNDSTFQDIEDISDFLKGSYKDMESRPTVLCTKECYDMLRSNNTLMLCAIGNDVFEAEDVYGTDYKYRAMRLVNMGLEEDRDKTIEMVNEMGIDYIIISDEYSISDYLAKLSFFKVIDKETFDLYEKQDYDLNYGVYGYIRRLYFYLLKRKCTQEELDTLASAYLSETMNFSEIAVYIMGTKEYEAQNYGREDMIYWLFEAILDRKPNEGDIAFMTGYLGDIEDRRFIIEQYMKGEEFSNLINQYK